ncbi:MAG: SDR family NAD(P)-dependent oxidoreductase, partial [Trebonia sp.]
IDGDRAEAVAAEVGGVPFAADVLKRADIEATLAFALETSPPLGPLRTVVDIVGISRYSPLLDGDDDWWRSQHAIILDQAFRVTQVFGWALTVGGGSIVHISSVAGFTGSPGSAAYASAKAGILSLVRTAAVELGPHGVRVNAVSPGHTMTPRVLARMQDGEPFTTIEPLRRHAEPGDIAAAVLFLATGLSRHVTGQNLVVDGGTTIINPFLAFRLGR